MAKHLDYQILDRAIDLVKNNWTRGFRARTKNGNACVPWSDDAHTFCAYGALDRAMFEIMGEKSRVLIEETTVFARIKEVGEKLYPPYFCDVGFSHGLMAINDEKSMGQDCVIKILEAARKV